MARTPEQIADKHIRNLSASLEDIRAGVQAVTEAPGLKAAKSREKWLQRTRESADKWEENVASVPLDSWQRSTIEKGVDRIPQGAAASRQKQIQFHTQLQAFRRNSVEPELSRLPDTTLENRLQRMMVNARRMSEFRFRRSQR